MTVITQFIENKRDSDNIGDRDKHDSDNIGDRDKHDSDKVHRDKRESDMTETNMTVITFIET